MNKGIIFGLGFATGALVGGIAAYEVAKKKIEKSADEEMDRYSQYCKEKIAAAKAQAENGDPNESEDEVVDDDDDAPVKRYHHYNEESVAEAYNTVFSKKPKEKKVISEEEMSQMKSNLDARVATDNPGIDEISEEEFGESDYQCDYLDFLFPDEELYYGWSTDNEIPATKKYGVKDKNEIISEFWKWAPDYVKGDEGVGSFYVRNHNLGMDFEVTVHMLTAEE